MIDICIAEITSFLPESFSEETLFVRGCREIDSVRLAKVEACKSGENKARSLCCGLMLQYYLRRHLGVEKKVEILYGYDYFYRYKSSDGERQEEGLPEITTICNSLLRQ